MIPLTKRAYSRRNDLPTGQRVMAEAKIFVQLVHDSAMMYLRTCFPLMFLIIEQFELIHRRERQRKTGKTTLRPHSARSTIKSLGCCLKTIEFSVVRIRYIVLINSSHARFSNNTASSPLLLLRANERSKHWFAEVPPSPPNAQHRC